MDADLFFAAKEHKGRKNPRIGSSFFVFFAFLGGHLMIENALRTSCGSGHTQPFDYLGESTSIGGSISS
jgi:hypothetical protein